jgi:hypothetical protein
MNQIIFAIFTPAISQMSNLMFMPNMPQMLQLFKDFFSEKVYVELSHFLASNNYELFSSICDISITIVTKMADCNLKCKSRYGKKPTLLITSSLCS